MIAHANPNSLSLIVMHGADNKRRRPSPTDALRSERPPPKQPSPPRWRQKLLHAWPGQLQWRRAPLVVPPAAFHRALTALFLDTSHPRDHRGVWARGRRCEVRDTALPVHVRERESEAERAVLLARVEDMGRCGNPARVEKV